MNEPWEDVKLVRLAIIVLQTDTADADTIWKNEHI